MTYLSEELIKEYKEIMLEEDGIKLTDEDAIKFAEAEVKFWNIVLRPSEGK